MFYAQLFWPRPLVGWPSAKSRGAKPRADTTPCSDLKMPPGRPTAGPGPEGAGQLEDSRSLRDRWIRQDPFESGEAGRVEDPIGSDPGPSAR